MDQFIRLGKKLINLANVLKVEPIEAHGSLPNEVQITYLGGEVELFAGAERDALLRWIDTITPDLLAPPDLDAGSL